MVIYLLIAIYGLHQVMNEGPMNLNIFFTALFMLYGIALARAWSLVGIRKK